MNVIDRIGKARALHLTEHRVPARIWLSSEDWAAMHCDPRVFQLDRYTKFMGMPFVEDRLTQKSRVVAEDGTAIALDDIAMDSRRGAD